MKYFVFGSNSNGVHNGNAAATVMKFGAIMGQAVGIQGQTYALPSKHIENLKKHIDDFLLYAEQHPEYIFLVTEIGCGISKHSPFEIAPLFKEAVHIKNINLPLSFWDVLNGGIPKPESNRLPKKNLLPFLIFVKERDCLLLY